MSLLVCLKNFRAKVFLFSYSLPGIPPRILLEMNHWPLASMASSQPTGLSICDPKHRSNKVKQFCFGWDCSCENITFIYIHKNINYFGKKLFKGCLLLPWKNVGLACFSLGRMLDYVLCIIFPNYVLFLFQDVVSPVF